MYTWCVKFVLIKLIASYFILYAINYMLHIKIYKSNSAFVLNCTKFIIPDQQGSPPTMNCKLYSTKNAFSLGFNIMTDKIRGDIAIRLAFVCR